MQKVCEKLKAHFRDLCCQPYTSRYIFTEPQNRNNSEVVDSYNVSFTQDGIVINAFDKFSGGPLGMRSCIDNIIINCTDTKYIELKNTVNDNIKDLGSKFYYAYLKSSPILEITHLNTNIPKFVIIYTKENFGSYTNSNNLIDPFHQKHKILLNKCIKAWENNKAIIPYPLKFSFSSHEDPNINEIPIVKIKYDESIAPIPLDNY